MGRLWKSKYFWLFVATFLSVCLAGAEQINQFDFKRPLSIFSGLPFALATLTILGLHEAGHYFAGRLWGMGKISPPVFIPLPFSPLGTMGAFISIKEKFPNRRALFDVAMAGPWFGLVATWGVWNFQDSFKSPATQSQVAFAIYVGLVLTFFNLFPLGFLDGGHTFYALAGQMHRKLVFPVQFVAIFYGAFVQGSIHPVTILVILLLFGFSGGLWRHPPTSDDVTPLGKTRKYLAILTLALFLGLGTITVQYRQYISGLHP